ncbi:MAG: DUF4169 family protein [Pseudomonadota bacterium]
MKVVNLNKARKAREKADAKARADQNAIKFGRTKAEKAEEAAQKAAQITRLDGHKLDNSPEK